MRYVSLKSVSLLLLVSASSVSAKPWKRPYQMAATDVALNNVRCKQSQDFLGNTIVGHDPAKQRVDWAYRCKLIEDNKFTRILWTSTLNDDSGQWEKLPDNARKYPIFAENKPEEDYPLWIPKDYDSCDIPENVIWLTVCMTGCYDKDQVLSFADGDHEIQDAEHQHKSDIKVVAKGSSFSDISYTYSDAGYYTKSEQEENHTLLEIKTDEGSIVLTKNHPLVASDGRVKEAVIFKVGDSLVREDGSLSKITSIEEKKGMTKVYNLAPKSTLAEDNIVVAQGFLNGSARFQNKNIRDFQRVMARSVIPVDFL